MSAVYVYIVYIYKLYKYISRIYLRSKPCANLAQTLRCLAVLLHLVGGPLLKEKEKACERHSNVHLVFFFLLYLFGKHPYIVYIYKLYKYISRIYLIISVIVGNRIMQQKTQV